MDNNNYIRLAGVTFSNDPEDGGRNRQDLIKEIASRQGAIINVSLDACSWEGEYGIKVKDKKTKTVIGWIPRNMLHDEKLGKQMTATLMEYKGTWSAKLTPVEAPTKAQYHFMVMLCKRTGRPMPTYDRRAYNAVFKELRENA